MPGLFEFQTTNGTGDQGDVNIAIDAKFRSLNEKPFLNLDINLTGRTSTYFLINAPNYGVDFVYLNVGTKRFPVGTPSNLKGLAALLNGLNIGIFEDVGSGLTYDGFITVGTIVTSPNNVDTILFNPGKVEFNSDYPEVEDYLRWFALLSEVAAVPFQFSPQLSKTVFAGPSSGPAGQPTFRYFNFVELADTFLITDVSLGRIPIVDTANHRLFDVNLFPVAPFYVDAATDAPFPAYVYSTSGRVSTITITAHGIAPVIDGIDMAKDNIFLFQHGTNDAHNGLYIWTVSSSGTSAKAIRLTGATTPTGMYPQYVIVRDGILNGHDIFFQTMPSPTIGTDPIIYAPYGAGTGWSANGNSFASGTYIGTNNAQPFLIRTHGLLRITVTANGLTGFGQATPTATVHITGVTVQSPFFVENQAQTQSLEFRNDGRINRNGVLYSTFYGTDTSWGQNAGRQFISTGNFNTAVGYRSAFNFTGSRGTFYGASSGNTAVDGTDLTLIGYASDVNSASLSNGIAIGSGAKITANNQFVAGSATVPITEIKWGYGVSVTNPLTPTRVFVSTTDVTGANRSAATSILAWSVATGSGSGDSGNLEYYYAPPSGVSGTSATRTLGMTYVGNTGILNTVKPIQVYITSGIDNIFLKNTLISGQANITIQNESGTNLFAVGYRNSSATSGQLFQITTYSGAKGISLDTSGNIALGADFTTTAAAFPDTSYSVTAYSSGGMPLVLRRNDLNVGHGLTLDYKLYNASSAYVKYAGIGSTIVVNTAGAESGNLSFGVVTAGSFLTPVTITGNSINLVPYGSSSGNTSEVRYYELVANGTNYVGFKAPNSITGNIIWTLPATDSTGSQALTSDGSGILSWTSIGGGGTVTSATLDFTDSSVSAIFDVSGSNTQTINTTGTFAITLNTQTTNKFFASPNGSTGAPTFRAIVAADLPVAAADGSTKGISTFTAADFNASTGVISIDYTNGQAADGSHKGFLTSTDWTTFNNKVSSQWTTSGSDIYFNTGNVGIGTTPTSNVLEVFGQYQFTGDGNLLGDLLVAPPIYSNGFFQVSATNQKVNIGDYTNGSGGTYIIVDDLSQSIQYRAVSASGHIFTGDVSMSGKLTVTGAIDPTHLYLDEQGSDPSNVANKGILYTKDISTITQLFYMDSAGTTYQITTSAGLTNRSLNNLSSVSINTSLLAQTGVDLGSTAAQFRNLYLFGAGTYATTYLKLTGTPTSTRTLTIPDATDTFALLAAAQAFTNKDLTGSGNTFPTFNQNTSGSAATLTTSRAIGGVSFNGSADITVATATGGFTVSGGNLAIGANNLTLTGSIGATGARATKVWTTDLEISNLPSVNGTALTTTIAKLNLLTNAGGVTGTDTTNIVFSTSPTLVTPVLGVATVTSVNKYTMTAPATGSTITILDGKTFTLNNTIIFAGTDSTTMTFPSTSATIARTDAANTFTGAQTFSSSVFVNTTAGTFRTTNGGSNITATCIIDPSGSVTAGTAFTFDATNSRFGITTANGTRRIQTAAMALANVVTTAGSESADLDFYTKTAATAVAAVFRLTSIGDAKLLVAGGGIYVKEGSNCTMGVATLVAGTVVVSTSKVTANSRIFLEVQSLGTVAVATPVAITARTAGTSFTISSSSVTDTSVISWIIFEPS